MKILFATNQDEKVAVTHRIISQIKDTFNPLLSTDATKVNLISTLTANKDISLFIASHGENAAIIDQNNIQAIQIQDIELLQQRHTFAYCCWTANELGKEIQRKLISTTYWGYTGQVLLSDYPELDEEMLLIFSFIYERFDNSIDQTTISVLLEELRHKCDMAYERIVEQYDDFSVIMQAKIIFRCIWIRLRAFTPHLRITHPEGIFDILY